MIIHRLAALLSAIVVAAFLSACGESRAAAFRDAAMLTGGDPHKGLALIQYYGCGGCHTIGGVPKAVGQVGPPLTGIALRTYIAGVLDNTPENMMRWIRNPKAVDEKTAMPYLAVSEEDARHITAYLYTLR